VVVLFLSLYRIVLLGLNTLEDVNVTVICRCGTVENQAATVVLNFEAEQLPRSARPSSRGAAVALQQVRVVNLLEPTPSIFIGCCDLRCQESTVETLSERP